MGNDEVDDPSGNKCQEEEILCQLRRDAELRKQAKQDTGKRKRLATSDDEGSVISCKDNPVNGYNHYLNDLIRVEHDFCKSWYVLGNTCCFKKLESVHHSFWLPQYGFKPDWYYHYILSKSISFIPLI